MEFVQISRDFQPIATNFQRIAFSLLPEARLNAFLVQLSIDNQLRPEQEHAYINVLAANGAVGRSSFGGGL